MESIPPSPNYSRTLNTINVTKKTKTQTDLFRINSRNILRYLGGIKILKIDFSKSPINHQLIVNSYAMTINTVTTKPAFTCQSNNGNTRTICETHSKLTITTIYNVIDVVLVSLQLTRVDFTHCSGVPLVEFEQMLAGKRKQNFNVLKRLYCEKKGRRGQGHIQNPVKLLRWRKHEKYFS